MGLYINLLHEQKTQQKQAERDPLKLGVLALLVLGVLLAGIFAWKKTSLGRVQSVHNEMAAKYATLEPFLQQYEAEKDALEAKVAVRDEIIKQIEERFFWAPIFEMISRRIPREVLLTSFRGNVNSQPYVIDVAGMAAGAQPRDLADRLRTSLIEGLREKYTDVSGEFLELEDSAFPLKVDGVEYPAAEFSIRLKMVERPTEDAAAQPQPQT